MNKLTAIKIKYEDGTYSDEIPVSVLAENVEWDRTHTLVDVLGSIDVDVTGTIQDQINQLFNEEVNSSEMLDTLNTKLQLSNTKLNSTKAVPTLSMDARESIYEFSDTTYKLAQGMCVARANGISVIIVARTTGKNTDYTKYVCISADTKQVLSETLLHTGHSNSLTYNSHTDQVVCVDANHHVYVMSIDNEFSIAVDQTIDTERNYSAIGYNRADKTYYMYGNGYIHASTDLQSYEMLWPVNFTGHTSQGMCVYNNHIYHCTSENSNNVIWEYSLDGTLIHIRTLPVAIFAELEEVDYLGDDMLVNTSKSEAGGVYLGWEDTTIRKDLDQVIHDVRRIVRPLIYRGIDVYSDANTITETGYAKYTLGLENSATEKHYGIILTIVADNYIIQVDSPNMTSLWFRGGLKANIASMEWKQIAFVI